MKARQIGLVVLKLAITFGLLFLLAKKIDLDAVVVQLRALQIFWAMAATVLLFAQLLITGIRWYIVSMLVSAAIRLGKAIRLVLIGQFFNQILPTSVGGDAVRAWLMSREKVPLGRAVISIVCDRVVALVVLTVIAAATLPLLSSEGLYVPLLEHLAVGALTLTALGLIFLLLVGEKIANIFHDLRLLRPVGVLIRNLRIVLFASDKSIVILGLALLVQVIMVMVILVCAMAIGIHLGVIHMLLLPSILLISMIPISFAGWGVREGAMVVVLGFAGISAPQALAISLLFGLTQMAIGVPGGVLWLLRRSGKDAITSGT